jgi:enolase
MVDVAVAVGSEYIKCGPTRGERVCKYNRLMRIEEEIIKI